ncbi:Folylpolyglutamate synthase [Pseudocercospora fuligena]|uniref:Folylpolyglutamate synthase n=1 Tax=Pseudocercospora fuligena TaxID=685502 RepID=A0A8H6R8Y0_9PEZI|nr:Folylpolyglutamate synthase [Pseudocercospora fuligena]
MLRASSALRGIQCCAPRGACMNRVAHFTTLVDSGLGPRPASPTYNDALKYLNSLQNNYKVLEERRKNPPKDLTKNDSLHEMLQSVEDAGYKPSDFDALNAVHVAGTKGKGTTCAFVNSILNQYRERYGTPKQIGLYTSPHLLSVCERIRINSRPISERKFTQYFFELWDRLEHGAQKRGADPGLKPTYFRYLTLLSLHAFVREEVDVAIYEVGVGGEFDSTNVLSKPAAVGITSLGIDHVQVLGNTVEEIAWQKAGIMKLGSPAYTVAQPEGAMKVLEKRAEEKQVVLQEVPIGKCLRKVAIVPDEDYQKRNASLAIVLASRVLDKFNLPLDKRRLDVTPGSGPNELATVSLDENLPDLFKSGLKTSLWRGRGEIVRREYGTWYLDGAHTTESLKIVCDWFGKTVQGARNESGKDPLPILIFNQQAETRNARQLINTVQQTLQQEWAVRPEKAIFCSNVTYKTNEYKPDFVDSNSDPTAVKTLSMQRDYSQWWNEADPKSSTHVVRSIEEAVELARKTCEGQPELRAHILVTGTFRIVGGALTILEGSGIATEASTTAPPSG